jgi:hypothetical protein
MHTEYLWVKELSPQERTALVDAAKARALVLRREASRDFWHAVAHLVRQAAQALRASLPAKPRHHLKA